MHVAKGSKTDLTESRFTVSVRSPAGLVDVAAVLLGADGRVRSDRDFIFFNNTTGPGATLVSDETVRVDLDQVPEDVQRVLISGSTEAQNRTFGETPGLQVEIRGERAR